jgi:hypothetical protein
MYNHIKLLVSAISFLPLLAVSQAAIAENSTKEEPVKVQDLQFSSQISSTASDLIANKSISNTQPTLAQAESSDPEIEIPAFPDITQPEPTFGSSVTIIPQISTLGAGLGLATPINGNLMARGSLHYTGFGLNFTSNNTKYNGNLNLISVSALVDYYPFGIDSFFAITGGLTYQNNRINGGINSGTVNYAGVDYVIPSDSRINANVKFPNNFAPYLGLSFGGSNGNKAGFGFFANLGVVFAGSPQIDLNATGSINSLVVDGKPFSQAIRDENAKIQRDISFPGIYPVLSLGFTYQF